MESSGSLNKLFMVLVVLIVCKFSVNKVEAIGFGDILSWLAPNLKTAEHLKTEDTNDEAFPLDTHGMIRRAGFKFENYYALSEDGYMTQLIRIINPLADAQYLKRPPVMIQHGQTTNSKNFVYQSNIQHFPMRYPNEKESQHELDFWSKPGEEAKKEVEGPKYSSNRSLALMLANNGFDVWLASVRGVDANNMGYIRSVTRETVNSRRDQKKNMTKSEDELLLERTKKSYWSFTLDDQITHETPSQILTILNVTGTNKITLIGYSNTALTTFAMLSIRHDIAHYVDTYISLAPTVYYNKLSGWFKWFMEGLMLVFPKKIDANLFINLKVAKFIRYVALNLCKSQSIRYSVCKFVLDVFFGDSSQFRTQLELPFFGHLIRPTTWKCLAQHLQIVRTHKLRKYDYGFLENKHIYGQVEPPEYKLSDINPNVRVALVSGEKDCWANQATLDKVRRELPSKPVLDLVLPDYNHLDLTGAYDVDVQVNLPLLKLLNERHNVLLEQKLLDWDTYDDYDNAPIINQPVLHTKQLDGRNEADNEIDTSDYIDE